MKYCTKCGAQLPDGAKFCTSCGTPVATAPDPVRATTTPEGGIVIDAPPGSTVTVSDGPQAPSSMEAPDQPGEFTMVSWDEPGSPAPQPPQQQPRPQQPTYQQPTYQQPQRPSFPQQPFNPPPAPKKKKKRGGCLLTLLVLAALIGAGIYLYPKYFSGKKVTTHPETVAGITFALDDGFSITDQYPLDGGANIVLTPDDSGSDTDMMQLILLPGILDGADDLSTEQLSALLKDSVRKLADVIAGNYGLDPDYPVSFDTTKTFPIAYTTFDGEDADGNPVYCHAETVLVDGASVVGSCSVAGSKQMLSRMVGIYENVVEGARKR